MNQFLSQGMGCIGRQAFSDSTTRGNKTATAHKFQNTLESEVNRLIIICSAEKIIQYTCLVIKLLQTCSWQQKWLSIYAEGLHLHFKVLVFTLR